jgi:TatA/E family protein of Tat protein translocase
MFGSLGFTEIAFILVLALLLFGPKRLPEIGRTIGKGLGEFRRASNDLRRTLENEVALEEGDSSRRPAIMGPPRPLPVPVGPPAPADSAPADKAPADSAPAGTAPAGTAPADTAPADTVPADTAPAARPVERAD